MRILIADDDEVTRRVLASLLTRLGHEVTGTADGFEALERLKRESFRVVISDWMMPGMDGLELTRRIRAGGPPLYTYVILLTALGDRASHLLGMDAGADDFMTKPLDVEILSVRLRVAERILSLQQVVRQLEGMLPVCSYCRRIREGDDTWLGIEEYLVTHANASFSHSVCPECYSSQVRPQLDQLGTRRAVDRTGT